MLKGILKTFNMRSPREAYAAKKGGKNSSWTTRVSVRVNNRRLSEYTSTRVIVDTALRVD